MTIIFVCRAFYANLTLPLSTTTTPFLNETKINSLFVNIYLYLHPITWLYFIFLYNILYSHSRLWKMYLCIANMYRLYMKLCSVVQTHCIVRNLSHLFGNVDLGCRRNSYDMWNILMLSPIIPQHTIHITRYELKCCT